MNKRIIAVAGAIALILVAVAVLVLAINQYEAPKISEERVQQSIMAAIQDEAPASFYVTGYIDVTATSRMRTSRVVLPGMLDWETGAVEATARVPGRVHYGFDVRDLNPEDISVDEENVIHVRIPEIVVYATEPHMDQMDLRTDHGWVRMHSLEREKRTEREAIQRIQVALQQQGDRHLRNTDQTKINTAEALETMLRPVLQSVGISDPSFRFNLDDRLVYSSASS